MTTTPPPLPKNGERIRVTRSRYKLAFTLQVARAERRTTGPNAGKIAFEGVVITKTGIPAKNSLGYPTYRIVAVADGDWEPVEPAEPKVTLVKLVPTDWQHAAGDTKPATSYAVQIDGQTIGHVYSRSTESYRSDGTTSRIRYGFQGYRRTWGAVTNDFTTLTKAASTRVKAVQMILDHHRKGDH